MRNKLIAGLIVMIVVVSFWAGWLTAPEKVRIEKVPGTESVIYKLDEIPLNAITAYLGVQGLEILPKAEKIKAEEHLKTEAEKNRTEKHLVWQSGYMAGYAAGKQR